VCRYCGEQGSGGFHVRPLFLVLVLVAAAAFGAATIFAARLYQAKQQQLGQMYFGRGQAALAAGQPEAAIQDFRNALYYSHDDPQYRLRLAQALAAANRTPEAQSYLLSLWQDEPSNSTVNLQLARLAAKQGESQAALRYYHGAIYGFWPDGQATERRGETRLELIHYLLTLHDLTQADAELIALTPELPRRAAAHAEVGRLFLQTGDASRALEEFQRAVRLDPRDASALWGAGQAAFQLRQYRPAQRYLDRAVRLQPRLPEAQALLATARLILALNPNQRGLSSRQRAQRIIQNFQYAQRRVNECLSRTAEQPAAAAASGAAQPAASKPAPAPKNAASGLMAKLLGKVERPPAATTPAPSPANGADLQQLAQQAAQLQRGVRTYRVERDPQLADSVMNLVARIELATAQQCGAPQGADYALLLLARQAEEP
jgi:tetratricopeptide (TPR) repeat protein